MTTENKIDALIAAQDILMKARIATVQLTPVHAKLVRVMEYLNQQAAEMLALTVGE